MKQKHNRFLSKKLSHTNGTIKYVCPYSTNLDPIRNIRTVAVSLSLYKSERDIRLA